MTKSKQNLDLSMRTLFQRMRHGVPAAAMPDLPTLETQSHINTNTSAQPHNGRGRPSHPPVQHGSSTWLERPTIAVLSSVPPVECVFVPTQPNQLAVSPDAGGTQPNQPAVSPDAGGSFTPVASMRRYTHLHLSGLDNVQARGLCLTTCSTRFDALSVEGSGPQEDDESITSAKPGPTDQNVSTGKKAAAVKPGKEKPLTSDEESAYLDE